MNDDFFPIRLNTLRADQAVSFDVYLLICGKYYHYTHAQDEMEGKRLKHLKSKGLRKLFIKTNHEESYLLYLENGLNNLNDTSLDLTARGALAHDTLVTAAENAERTLETESGFKSQQQQFNKITDFLMSDKNALKGILSAAGISTDTNQHAATVSSLALAVATKAGVTDEKELFELGIAALLHDIGKNRLKFDAFKAKDQMTPDEYKQYKNHPQDGADMLAGKPYISPRILGLISSHEEIGLGRGFPEKKDLFKLPLSYQILSMVNKFDHFATEMKILPSQAIDPFYDKYNKEFPDDLIATLATVLT